MNLPLIEFDEPSHTYKVDGLVLPSVTQVLRLLDRGAFAGIPRDVLEAKRGPLAAKENELSDHELRLQILDLSIEFTQDAKMFLMEKGFDPALGARPLRRAIQKFLEDPLSEILLKRGFNKEAAIQVGVGDDQLTFEVAAKT